MLALIAGQGRLPAYLAERLAARGAPFVICEMRGFPTAATGAPLLRFRIEHLGSLMDDLQARGVSEICLAGAVRRPVVEEAALDAATRPLAPRIARAIASGDDAALRIVLEIFEERGFAIRGAHELAPELLPPAGIPTRARPGEGHRRDISLADAALARLGAADIGQACVVAGGRVVATEGPAGTDAMLAALPREARGGLLAKAPKPGQERRADLPTIGPGTVAAAARAGLGGIAIEAGGVLVLERDEVIEACDGAGLFLWVREAGPCTSS